MITEPNRTETSRRVPVSFALPIYHTAGGKTLVPKLAHRVGEAIFNRNDITKSRTVGLTTAPDL